MTLKEQAGFRAEPTLIARIDAFAEQMMRDHPGLNVSRTDAIVMLLTEALNARGIEAPAEVAASTKRAKAPATAKKGAKRARKP